MNKNLDIEINIDNTTFNILFIKEETFHSSMPKHSHGKYSYEIHYISGGKGILIADDKEYSLYPKCLFITGPNIEHQQIPDNSDPMTECCVYLKINNKGKLSSLISTFCNTHFWFGRDSQNIIVLFQQIFYEITTHNIGYETNLESLLRQLIVSIIRNYKNQSVSDEAKYVYNIENKKFLIIEEYFLYSYNNLSLSALSKLLQLSNRQTERVLESYYGKSFVKKKYEARMSAATVLLTNNSKPITDIASELGYASTSHFCNAFKKYYSVTPNAYRRNLNL